MGYRTRTGHVVEVNAADMSVGPDTRYGMNDRGTIGRGEVLLAVRDCCHGSPGVDPSREEVPEPVSLDLSE